MMLTLNLNLHHPQPPPHGAPPVESVTVMISAPSIQPTFEGLYTCDVAIPPALPTVHHVRGTTPFGALSNAGLFVSSYLDVFTEHGGRVEYLP